MTESDRMDKTESDKIGEKGGKDLNLDPLSGTPGAHPLGTGAGAAGGAAAGAAIGTMVGGPVGLAAGGVIGAVVGGLAGKATAEAVNPTLEDAYWRDNYRTKPYAADSAEYDVYQPAYKHGWEARDTHKGREWDEVETDVQTAWERDRKDGWLDWDHARPAARDAWDHAGSQKRG